jgi:hypothetical protein
MMFANYVRPKRSPMMDAKRKLQKTAESVQFCTDSGGAFQEN